MKRSPARDETRFRREFVAEAESVLEKARAALDALGTPAGEPAPATLNALFRAIHSLKGLAGMVGLAGLAQGAHELESLLEALRMGRVPVDGPSLAALGKGLSTLADQTESVASGETDRALSEGLLGELRRAAEPRAEAPGGDAPGAVPLPPALEAVLTDYERHRLSENARKGRRIVILPLEFSLEAFDEGLRKAMGEAGAAGELVGTFPGSASSREAMSFQLLVGLGEGVDPASLAALCGASGFVELASGAPSAAPAPPAPPSARPATPTRLGATVRVDLEKIGHLLDLAAEASLARGALKLALDRLLATSTDRPARQEAQRAFAHVDRAVAGLGRAALATRLVPVEQLAARLERAVVSISASLGKEAAFEVVGGETEIDKVLGDELTDLFLHLVRNALDHGLEPPEERAAAGKPREGRIVLTAASRGRDVVFTLADDGRGIDPAAVARRARELGLLDTFPPEPADPLAPIFLPGFSTATSVSELSGRGVGLDAVRSKIEAMKGSVSVESRPWAGTSFEVVVPVTLAVVESLLVRSGSGRFAFATSSVARTFRTGPGSFPDSGGEGGPLPLVPLGKLLGLGPTDAQDGDAVVVAEHGSRCVGFIVSAVEGMEDLVVKPLASAVPRARAITGTAELADGGLALTLDTGLLIESALDAARGAP